MSLTGCSASNYRRVNDGLSPALSSANVIATSCWVYLPSTLAAGGLYRLCESLASNTHGQGLGAAISPNNWSVRVRSNTTSAVAANTGTPTLDTWVQTFLIVEGPHDGTSSTWELRVNDSVIQSASFTTQNYSTTTIDTIQLGGSYSVDPAAGHKMAYFGIGSYASLADARTACTACQSQSPSAVSGMVYAWDLNNSAANSLGGIDLAAVGTGATLDTDMPTLSGGGGGGSVFINVCGPF